MKILIRAQLEKFASRVDRSYSITFGTPELKGEDVKALGELLRSEVALYCSQIAIEDADIEMLESLAEDKKEQFGDKAKTQAQRIRAVLYRIWEQQGGKDDFEDFYRKKTEEIINNYKEKYLQ